MFTLICAVVFVFINRSFSFHKDLVTIFFIQTFKHAGAITGEIRRISCEKSDKICRLSMDCIRGETNHIIQTLKTKVIRA